MTKEYFDFIEHILSCSCSPPPGTLGESVTAIRRFHSLRSFHQRLFTFAPFGDGKWHWRNSIKNKKQN